MPIGTLAATEAPDNATIRGVVPIAGALAATEAADTASITGHVAAPWPPQGTTLIGVRGKAGHPQLALAPIRLIDKPPVNRDPDLIYQTAFNIASAVVSAYNGDGTNTIPQFKTIRVSPMLLTQPSQLPRLGVYRNVAAAPEGDWNSGNARFNVVMTMTYSAAVVRTDDDQQFKWVWQLCRDLNNALMTNGHFMQLHDGVINWTCRSNYSQVAETPIAECNLQHQYGYRDEWSPVLYDDFLIWHIDREIRGSAGWQTVHEGEYDAATGEPISSGP
jgi:hypothetical protein